MNIWISHPYITIDGDKSYFGCENSLIKGGDLIITSTWYHQVRNRFVGKVYEVDYVKYVNAGFNLVYITEKNDTMFQGELC